MPAAKFSLKDVDRGLTKLKQLDKVLASDRTHVRVGVIGNRKSAHEPVGPGLDEVGLAIIHEFGSPSRSIPARSWIRSTFDTNRKKYDGLVRFFVGQIYDLKMKPERALGLLGVILATDIKNRVTQGPSIPPPNAPSTLRRKMKLGRQTLSRNTRALAKREGVKLKRGKAQGPIMVRTLVDTGRMVGSVSWVVSIQGKEGANG